MDHERRIHQHRHNGLCGSVILAKKVMQGINNSPTTTKRTKELAEKIHVQLITLAYMMEERVELDGSIKVMNHANS